MNLKVEAVEIDGVKFETQQFAAMRAVRLLARLVKTAGPAIAVFQAADQGAELAAIAGTVAAALADVDPSQLDSLILEILAGTTAWRTTDEGKVRTDLITQAKIDAVFSGKLMMLFQVVAHAVKVNFSDFGGGSVSSAPTTA